MKKCFKCGAVWSGFSKPRSRQICGGCGAYLHICLNCHHFDREVSYSCKLPHTTFVGSREALNYCEDFEMVDVELKTVEARLARARTTWANLFKK